MFHKSATFTIVAAMLLVICLLVAQDVSAQPPLLEAAQTFPVENSRIELPESDEVIMTYGDKEITIQHMHWMAPGRSFMDINFFADDWLTGELILKEAKRLGLDITGELEYKARMYKKKLYLDAFHNHFNKSIEINEAEIRDYYDKNKDTDDALKTPVYLSFSHIESKTLEKAQEVLAQIKAGEDINALAKKVSLASDAKRGGHAGKHQAKTVKRRIGREFLDALLNAKEGDLIGPIKNSDGNYEVARHEGKRAAKLLEYDKVKTKIDA